MVLLPLLSFIHVLLLPAVAAVFLCEAELDPGKAAASGLGGAAADIEEARSLLPLRMCSARALGWSVWGVAVGGVVFGFGGVVELGFCSAVAAVPAVAAAAGGGGADNRRAAGSGRGGSSSSSS